MNLMQTAVLKVYSDGDYAEYTTAEEVIDYCGDDLVKFILNELSDEEDCTNLDIATDRMMKVRDDIQLIIDELESM